MKRPVFIVGCPRSGTTLLYSMLIAAGGFAVYRKETYFYDLAARFPDLSDPRSHQQFMTQFLAGYLGRVPGLHVQPFLKAALERCGSTGEVLPLLMEGIASAQGMERWLEATPIHVLHMPTIKRAVPDALFIHVIRDGRDCAVSHTGQRWVRTLPWDSEQRLGVAALYWEWMARTGREYCADHPADCLEVRFETLTADPQHTLPHIGRFIDHDLDYDRIRENPVLALKRPNTSFRAERDRVDFNPIARWKKASPEAFCLCEALIGSLLEDLGYQVTRRAHQPGIQARARVMRATYLPYFATKQWLKTKTPAGRFLTRTRVWAEQPRAGEAYIAPLRAGAIPTFAADRPGSH